MEWSMEQRFMNIFLHSELIKNYIDLRDVKVRTFEEAIMQAAKIKSIPSKLEVSTDEEFQLLMVPIFNKQLGDWN